MAFTGLGARRRERKVYAKVTLFPRIAAFFKRFSPQSKAPDLSHLPDHLIRDIGLPLDDPRRTPPRRWIWFDYMPRG